MYTIGATPDHIHMGKFHCTCLFDTHKYQCHVAWCGTWPGVWQKVKARWLRAQVTQEIWDVNTKWAFVVPTHKVYIELYHKDTQKQCISSTVERMTPKNRAHNRVAYSAQWRSTEKVNNRAHAWPMPTEA